MRQQPPPVLAAFGVSPNLDPLTDQVIEAEEQLQEDLDAMRDRLSDFDCTDEEVEEAFCDEYGSLETGSFGLQLLEGVGIPSCDANGIMEE